MPRAKLYRRQRASEHNRLSCPKCLRRFRGPGGLRSHLNHPRSVCRKTIHDFVPLSEIIGEPTTAPADDELPAEGASQSHFDSNLDFNMEPPPTSTTSRLDASNKFTTEFPSDHATTYDPSQYIFNTVPTFMESFNRDSHASSRKINIYYPFKDKSEWELAFFLLRTKLSMREIDEFLACDLIKGLNLSFKCAKSLRGLAEMLPSGPRWKFCKIETKVPTKRPAILFFRDTVECLQAILHHPLVTDHLSFSPLRVFTTAEKICRKYTGWLTGNAAWEMQGKLPPGATLLGPILSSDKTQTTAISGGKTAYPVSLGLANIDFEFSMKALNHVFVLCALLPVAHFVHRNKDIRGVLHNRLVHECLDIITGPLKTAAAIGVMMSDPLGQQRFCFTPLAAYIADTPESSMLAAVAASASSVTMATFKQFGDSFQHEPRTASTTLAQLDELATIADPDDIVYYTRLAKQKFKLNGVHKPFWRDWPLTDPSTFLTPEPLHHWHKAFWDHDIRWCINIIGAVELDLRFAIQHPLVGFRRFAEGVSSLKQVTGREHREMQRYLIPIIAEAVPHTVLIAIRSLMDFRYIGQGLELTDEDRQELITALQTFHQHKQSIVDAGGRRGKGNRIIHDWQIPKLEFLQSVCSSIAANGVPMQWTADTTERAHITEVKDPARSTNHQNTENQICRYLDRIDKCRRFDLASAISEANVSFQRGGSGDARGSDEDEDEAKSEDEENDQIQVSSSASLRQLIHPTSVDSAREFTNLFHKAEHAHLSNHSPPRYFTNSCQSTAFHLTLRSPFRQTAIDLVAQEYNIPDLREALADCISRSQINNDSYTPLLIGGPRQRGVPRSLPFKKLQVWPKIKIQSKSHRGNILPAKTAFAARGSKEWPEGRSDSVLVEQSSSELPWPASGLKGHVVAKLKLIFHVVAGSSASQLPPGLDGFLAYVQRYDIVPQVNQSISGTSQRGPYPEPHSTLYVLKPAKRSDGSFLGDVIPVSQIRDVVALSPRLGAKADVRLTAETSLAYSKEVYLNHYFDKEHFRAMRRHGLWH